MCDLYPECSLTQSVVPQPDTAPGRLRLTRFISKLLQMVSRMPQPTAMLRDIRYAIRALRQNLGFALTAIVSIALAIGVNSAIFSFVDGLLLRPLAVEDPSRVVTIRSVTPTMSASSFADPSGEMSYPDFVDFRDKSHSFAGVIAYDLKGVGFARDKQSQAEMKQGYTVSGNFFEILGVQTEIGRAFRPEEDEIPGRNAVIVLAHDFWRQEFGLDTSVIGRNVQLNGVG